MSCNPSVLWCFCAYSWVLVNVVSVGSTHNGSVVPVANVTAHPTSQLPEHPPAQLNVSLLNPGLNATLKPTPEHSGRRHLSTPKNTSILAVSGHDGASPLEPHKSNTTAQPILSTVAPHHVSVEVEKLEEDNVIVDVTHSAARQNVRSAKWNPTFAAIVAAICVTTAVGGYIMLITWRKIEMDRYGNRQMLINEDDFGDIQDEDMRHFEASCIQIDA